MHFFNLKILEVNLCTTRGNSVKLVCLQHNNVDHLYDNNGVMQKTQIYLQLLDKKTKSIPAIPFSYKGTMVVFYMQDIGKKMQNQKEVHPNPPLHHYYLFHII